MSFFEAGWRKRGFFWTGCINGSVGGAARFRFFSRFWAISLKLTYCTFVNWNPNLLRLLLQMMCHILRIGKVLLNMHQKRSSYFFENIVILFRNRQKGLEHRDILQLGNGKFNVAGQFDRHTIAASIADWFRGGLIWGFLRWVLLDWLYFDRLWCPKIEFMVHGIGSTSTDSTWVFVRFRQLVLTE